MGLQLLLFMYMGLPQRADLVSGCCSLSMHARTVFLLMFLFITYALTVAVVGGQGAFPREQRDLACSVAGYLGARGMGR